MKKLLTLVIAFITVTSIAYADGKETVKPFLKMTQTEKDTAVNKNLNYLQSHNIFNNNDRDELKKSFEPFGKDINSKENIKSAKQGIVFKDGYSLGIKYNEMYTKIMEYYIVKFDNNPKIRYLYDGFGNLTAVDIVKGIEFVYPYIVCRYSNSGSLTSVSYFRNSNEEYLYNINETITGVKINGILYNRKGTRLDPRVQNPVVKRVVPIRR